MSSKIPKSNTLSKARPTSYPFLSGDTFRDFADHVWDEDAENFNPSSVRERDVIFLPTHRVTDFFEIFHPKIKNKYILITHNSDCEVNKKVASLMDEKIIHWFAQNLSFTHPKLTPIPIGLENLHHNKNGIITNFEEAIKQDADRERVNKILYGFRWQNNPFTRILVCLRLKLLPTAEEISTWAKPKEYLELLSKYKFVASIGRAHV